MEMNAHENWTELNVRESEKTGSSAERREWAGSQELPFR